MNELKLLQYEGSEIRTLQKDNETCWVLKDVCKVLGVTSPNKVVSRLDEDEVTLIPLTDRLGRKQKTTIITESGLYNVILRSDKPVAKKFRRWVTHEVLPSIRRQGFYSHEELTQVIKDIHKKLKKPIYEAIETAEIDVEKWKNHLISNFEPHDEKFGFYTFRILSKHVDEHCARIGCTRQQFIKRCFESGCLVKGTQGYLRTVREKKRIFSCYVFRFAKLESGVET